MQTSRFEDVGEADDRTHGRAERSRERGRFHLDRKDALGAAKLMDSRSPEDGASVVHVLHIDTTTRPAKSCCRKAISDGSASANTQQ